jgi:general secretion pathway protein M
MRSLSAPVRRFAALGILALVLLFGYLGVAEPLIASYDAARADAETMRSAIARAAATGGATAELERQLAEVTERSRSANGFLPTTTDALASATLQDLVKNAIDKAHGDLRSTQILAAQEEGAARRVAVRAQFSADLAGVQKVFYDLESKPSILFLNNVQITRQQTPAAGRGAATSHLEVQFDIVGYMRGSG